MWTATWLPAMPISSVSSRSEPLPPLILVSCGFAPGPTHAKSKASCRRIYGSDLLVLTTGEFKERDRDYFLRTRPVDFIFAMGTAVGFFVGFAIVYQVLFSDVNNHLPQYATLKAIGYADGYLRRVVLEEAVILSLLGYFPARRSLQFFTS